MLAGVLLWVGSWIPFFYDIADQGRRRQNLIQWRNNSTIYAGIYLNGPTTGGGTGVFDISDNMIFNLEFQTLNDTNFGTRMTVDNAGILTCTELTTTSDDRLKTELQPISNATQTITKLTPQTYHKYNTMDGCGNYRFESGFIAQEIYYKASELRHLVHTKADISGHIDSYYWGLLRHQLIILVLYLILYKPSKNNKI